LSTAVLCIGVASSLQERTAGHLAGRRVHLAHAFAKDPLRGGTVAVGDHERHESAGLRRLRAGRLGCRQNRFGDLVEQGDLRRRELSERSVHRNVRLGVGGDQVGTADERGSAEPGCHETNRLASIEGRQAIHGMRFTDCADSIR
jgi:hypothetical protein